MFPLDKSILDVCRQLQERINRGMVLTKPILRCRYQIIGFQVEDKSEVNHPLKDLACLPIRLQYLRFLLQYQTATTVPFPLCRPLNIPIPLHQYLAIFSLSIALQLHIFLHIQFRHNLSNTKAFIFHLAPK